MNYIVLDLEWNQPRYAGEMVEDPVHLVGEIVQIGAVKMNERLSIKDELRLTVKPRYYRKMHRKVARITGLDNKSLEKGVSFPEAFRRLTKFCGKDFVFLTWGPDDVPMLRDNMILFHLDEDWLPPFYDLQVPFCHQKLDSPRQMALEDAIELVGEEPFQAHDALCDAKSTALICRHLDIKKGLRDYHRQSGDITAKPLDTCPLMQSFEHRGALLAELSTQVFPCPDSSEFLYTSEIVPQNANKLLSLATSTDGREYLVRFRLYRGERERIHVIREVFSMTDTLTDYYLEKKEKLRLTREQNRIKEKQKRARKRERREAEKELTTV